MRRAKIDRSIPARDDLCERLHNASSLPTRWPIVKNEWATSKKCSPGLRRAKLWRDSTRLWPTCNSQGWAL